MKKIMVGFAVVVLTGTYWLLRADDAPEKSSQAQAPAVTAAGAVAIDPLRPSEVYENLGAPHGVAPAIFEAPTPPGQEVRLGLGDTANIKFNQPRAHTGMGVGHMTARAVRAQDKPIELEVKKTDKGFEVPFTPTGPGQFNVTLNEDGNAVGAQLVGVVGAAGVADLTDPNKLFDADPMEFRARTPGKMSRR